MKVQVNARYLITSKYGSNTLPVTVIELSPSGEYLCQQQDAPSGVRDWVKTSDFEERIIERLQDRQPPPPVPPFYVPPERIPALKNPIEFGPSKTGTPLPADPWSGTPIEPRITLGESSTSEPTP